MHALPAQKCGTPHFFFALLTIALLSFFFSVPAAAASQKLVIALPGPGNLIYLPVELAKQIGADRAENCELEIRYFGGGPQAIRDMLDGNSDFSASGLPALAEQKAAGLPVRSISALTRVPGYALMVRNSYKSKIRKVADLRGHVIGVKGHTKGGRAASQMVAEYLLARAGLAQDSVNFIAAGQSYEDQLAALQSGAVDALVADEPFASRFQKQGIAYKLVDLLDLKAVRKQMGGLFLNAQVSTRDDVIVEHADKVEKMARIMRRTLQWIKHHSAGQIAGVMGYDDAQERIALANALSRHKDIYTPDGAFSSLQVKTTERFFHQVQTGSSASAYLRFRDLIDARWAGETR